MIQADHTRLSEALAHPQALLDTAFTRWEDKWKLPETPLLLDALEASEYLEADQWKKLSKLRKRGLEYRTALEFLTKEGKAPKSLRRFLKAIGDVKDEEVLAHVEPQEVDVPALQKYRSERVHPQMHAPLAVSADKALEEIAIIVWRIRKDMKKDELPFERFHELRKDNIRQVTNIFRLKKNASPEDMRADVTFRVWDMVNRRLGKAQDEVYKLQRLTHAGDRKLWDPRAIPVEVLNDVSIHKKRETVGIAKILRAQITGLLNIVSDED